MVLGVAFSLWMTTGVYAKSLKAVTSLKEGAPIPKAEFVTLDNKPFLLKPNKQLTLVSVFTTWCKLCKIELKDLSKQYEVIQEKKLPIRILAVNAGEPLKKVKRHIKRKKITVPVVVDSELVFVKKINAIGTPTVLIFNQKNQLVFQGNHVPKNWMSLN